MEDYGVRFGKIPSGTGKSSRDWKTGTNYEWYIQEKVDGSQLSFRYDPRVLHLRFFNRGKEKHEPYPSTFLPAISALQYHFEHQLPDSNLVFHGEAICKVRHNVATYERVPRYCFVLFSVQDLNSGDYIPLLDLESVAKRLNLELAPIWFFNRTPENDPNIEVDTLMSNPPLSFLGGEPEGCVLKHLHYVKRNGQTVASKFKFVSDRFKERHATRSKIEVTSPDQFIESLVQWYPLKPRLRKAIFRLRDREEIQIDTTDKEQRQIDAQKVTREMKRDWLDEEEELLKNHIWRHFKPYILKKITSGGFSSYVDDTYLDDEK